MSLQQKEFYIVEVIALILKYIKDQLLNLEEVCKGLTGALEASDFSWVVTVPAMWKARGKDMMRQAAYLVTNILYCILTKEGLLWIVHPPPGFALISC